MMSVIALFSFLRVEYQFPPSLTIKRAATAFCTAVAARLGHRPAGALVAWTLFAPVVWALCLAPALVVLALIVGLLYGHGIN